ncbi:hypothetical protein GCM10009115_20520 [Sphingopyxis soli]|jgi:UrcA family protein|uniref:UrcA family protein n=1 Tax=Sphingopyxis soli TaxID=592051 RepID=A0ABP3XJF3_9SPHN|nr:UrcA family protein [Sphingopyxis soli]
MTKTLILAALAATSLGQPAFAEPVTQTVVVQHSDLDLNTAAGARTLQHRVWRAVVAVCGTASDADIVGKNDIRQCRRDTMQVASAKADLAIAGASQGEPLRVASIRN